MIIFTVERAKEEKLEPNFKFPLINNILSHVRNYWKARRKDFSKDLGSRHP